MLIYLGIDPGISGGLAYLRVPTKTPMTTPLHPKSPHKPPLVVQQPTTSPPRCINISPRKLAESYGAIKMPSSYLDIWSFFKQFLYHNESTGAFLPLYPTYAVIEKVSGYIGTPRSSYKGNQSPGSSMFNFGVSYGSLLMSLTISGIPFIEAPPQTWQSAMSLRGRKYKHFGQRGHKTYLKEKSQLLFPNLRVSCYTQDALLLCHYCRSVFTT